MLPPNGSVHLPHIVYPDTPAPTGIKHDTGKARYDLIPPEGLHGVAMALTHGAAKYPAGNWEHGLAYSRYFASAQRHLWAWWAGENKDPESGLSHLWHAAACIFFLIAYESRNMTHLDDRSTRT